MTAHDLARLAIEIIRRFPELYPMYSEKTFTWATEDAGEPKSPDLQEYGCGRTENRT